jgi:hypothetical protein
MKREDSIPNAGRNGGVPNLDDVTESAARLQAEVPLAGAEGLMSSIAILALTLDGLLYEILDKVGRDHDGMTGNLVAASQALCGQIGWIADSATVAYGDSPVKDPEDWLLPPLARAALANARGAAQAGGPK